MISVITVVRNGASTIEQTILSVINQDYSGLEYIVIDGVSTDGTLEILHKYADRISQIKSEPDAGIYDAMNKGISVAKGDWVYFLGCDDIFNENTTLSQIFLNQDYINYDVIYGNVLFAQTNRIFDGEFDYDKHALKSICQQAIFYRKILFQKFGYFNTEYLSASDYIFNINVFCSNFERWLYINVIVAKYNETGVSSYVYDKKYQERNFAIRYDIFRPYVSEFILSRIFFQSYIKYFLSHNIFHSLKYLLIVIKDIGAFRLIANFLKFIKLKYSRRKY